MKTSRFKRQGFALLLLPLFLLAGCGPKHKSQADCGFVQNVYGERISWKDSAPVGLYVHESFPNEMLPALQRAMDDWARVLGRPAFRIIQTGYQSPGPRQDGMNVIYWMNTWEPNKVSEQARTSIYWLGDQIREADLRINASPTSHFTFYLDTATSPQDIHLESLLVHELGHVLGLKHKDDQGSVMATYLAGMTVRNKIPEADREDIKCEY